MENHRNLFWYFGFEIADIVSSYPEFAFIIAVIPDSFSEFFADTMKSHTIEFLIIIINIIKSCITTMELLGIKFIITAIIVIIINVSSSAALT